MFHAAHLGTATVAQIFNLLYRRIAFGNRWPIRSACLRR